jgi:UDP:flavonoid glycosyltransferase YjiC (YdhE family)
MPSKIVIASWGSYGDVYPYVGLGKALRALGHHVTLALPGYYRPLVEGEGLGCHPMAPDVDPDDRAAIARAMHPVKGPEEIVRHWVMPALRQSYDDLSTAARDADLIVTHPMAFAAPLVAEARGIPRVATVLSPMSFFSVRDVPVMAAAPWLTSLARAMPALARVSIALAHRATRDWVAPVQALRRELGLPASGHPLFEGQFSPTLNLALFSRVLASPQPDWPAHVRTTGFVFYNGPDPLPAGLEAFLAAGPPPVVFTLGSSAVGAAGPFYEESARAALSLGLRAVLMIGPIAENRPRAASTDLLLVDYAPHQLLFPRAAAVVHHGGVGTTGQVLRSGRPALVVPHSHDQPDNADRVTRLGTARTIFPRAYRARRIARDLDRLLREERYARAARSAAAIVATEGGADEAARQIAAILPS